MSIYKVTSITKIVTERLMLFFVKNLVWDLFTLYIMTRTLLAS